MKQFEITQRYLWWRIVALWQRHRVQYRFNGLSSSVGGERGGRERSVLVFIPLCGEKIAEERGNGYDGVFKAPGQIEFDLFSV